MLDIEEIKKYNTFEEFCDKIYCCNKNPWSDIDENCKECEEKYRLTRKNLGLITHIRKDKMEMERKIDTLGMEDFKNWNEITKGLYRYVIGANVCYEIHIELHYLDTDILTAKASLFIVGDWRSEGKSFFERECLLQSQPVFECIKKAIEDNESNSLNTFSKINIIEEHTL